MNSPKMTQIAIEPPDIVLTVVMKHLHQQKKDQWSISMIPQQNVKDSWEAIGILMEAVALGAADHIGNNPKDIESYEDMAQYVSEYITKAMMSAEPRSRKK